MAKLRMEVLHCPEKYEYMLSAVPPGALVIDGGCNLGIFSDLMIGMGAKVIAFEPNPVLCNHLRRKALDWGAPAFRLEQKAIYIENKTMTFSMAKTGAFIAQSQGGSIDVTPDTEHLDFEVESIDFAAYLRKLLAEGVRPYLIKLDIEGAEFEVLDQLIDEKLCGAFDYLVCETHERFFEDGALRIQRLKDRLKEEGITNVYLDWA